MHRTSRTLKRLGVPVVAATMLLTAGQTVLGLSAASAVTTSGTLTIAPNPGHGSATPYTSDTTNGDAQETVTYTAGSQSTGGTQAQTVLLTVSGSATIAASTMGSPNGTVTPVAGSNGKSATCTTTVPSGGTATCDFDVNDAVSEAVTVTATDQSPDNTAAAGQATVNFAGLYWSGCSTTTGTQTSGTCGTQQAQGTTSTYTLTYLVAGQPQAGENVQVTLTGNGGTFPASQPSGTQETFPNLAQCTTAADGTCKVNVTGAANAATNGYTAVLTAETGAGGYNSAPYPPSEAQESIQFVTSTTAAYLAQSSTTNIRPTGQADAVNEPGDAVQHTYTLMAADGTPLANQTVTLSVDHGFFTPNCTNNSVTTYANCTFNTTPANGVAVGDLKSLGTTETVKTNGSGVTPAVTLGIGRDSAFDQDGNVTAVVSTGNIVETNPGVLASGTNCTTTPGANGCPTGTAWTTDAQPLNGVKVSIVSVPNSSSEPALSDTSTNHVPLNNGAFRTFVVHLTDQFGNLTSGGMNTGNGANTADDLTLSTTGAGSLWHCTNYDNNNTCSNSTNAGASTSSNGSGVTTVTYDGVMGSYLNAYDSSGNPTQDRWVAFDNGNPGTQTITAAWNAPTTTFNTYVAPTTVTGAAATYTSSFKTVTDSVAIDWYNQNAQPVVTFSTTPSNKVRAGTVVTVSASVKDQYGQPINGDWVQFIRSGPNPNNGTDCSATNNYEQTDNTGSAGFSFTCNTPGTQTVTIVVQDNSGNELARGTQVIQFTGQSGTTKQKIHPGLTLRSPRRGVVRVTVLAHARDQGARVTIHANDPRGRNHVFRLRLNGQGKATRYFHAGPHHRVSVWAYVAPHGNFTGARTRTKHIWVHQHR